MEKYLFVDGTNVIREVESGQELQSLIRSAVEPSKVRIWIFHSSEWITLTDFSKRPFTPSAPIKKTIPVVEVKPAPRLTRMPLIPGVIKKVSIGTLSVAAIFLVYNFTRVTWRKASAISIIAERPANTPPTNVDSIIGTIELLRGQKLDKITRTNLRIRNTWPDLIQLQLTADRDSSREGLRYHNLEFSIDNSTGYAIDNAIVKLNVWKDGAAATDTFQFTNFSYAEPVKRKLETTYRGDSVSISFEFIRAKAFNFCYSADKKSNYGNYNDRWYCR